MERQLLEPEFKQQVSEILLGVYGPAIQNGLILREEIGWLTPSGPYAHPYASGPADPDGKLTAVKLQAMAAVIAKLDDECENLKQQNAEIEDNIASKVR